jgi:UPF0176 protein
MSNLNIKNIALYAFFKPSFELKPVRDILVQRMKELSIKGTILLALEGINGSFSGKIEDMDIFLAFLLETINIPAPPIKISFSSVIPFKRSLVKIKPFIVAKPGDTPLDLTQDSAPTISPVELHQWIKDNKQMVLLDTRNDYEYEVGRFKNAVHLGTKHFSQFEDDLQKAPLQWQDMPVVTFCTGGIRCEKAAPLMLKKGFNQVYQLDGGILNYFKLMGQGFFEGECFVFDHRRAVNEELNPA